MRHGAGARRKRCSSAELCLPWWTDSSAINILLLKAKVKHGESRLPTLHHTFELEITFCVRGVVSPLLANVYLHYVLDLWAQAWRRRRARGDVIIVRWADDFVGGFQYEDDGRRFLEELRERFQRFSLELHPEKTRLIRFGRLARRDSRRFDGKRKPETFNFLGFTHTCGVSREGKFLVRRTTMKRRLTAKLPEVKAELRRRLHQPVPEQGVWLQSVVRGYFAYHALPGNWKALGAFRPQCTRLWYRTLRRRSQKSRLTWERMTSIADAWLPPARILHPWPETRLAALIRGKSRMP